MIRQRMAVAAVAAAALIGLSACGSDSKSLVTSPSKETTTKDTEATIDTEATTEVTTAVTDGSNSEGVTLPPGISIPDISIPDFSVPDISIPDISIPDITAGEPTGECIQLQKDLEDVLGSNDLDNLDPDKFQQAFDEIAKRVPSDLKDDVHTVEDASLPFVKAMANVGTDFTKALQDPDVQAAMQKMNSPEFQTASNNLNTWFNDGCPS